MLQALIAKDTALPGKVKAQIIRRKIAELPLRGLKVTRPAKRKLEPPDLPGVRHWKGEKQIKSL